MGKWLLGKHQPGGKSQRSVSRIISNADGVIQTHLNDRPGFAITTVSVGTSEEGRPRIYEGQFVSELVGENNVQSDRATFNRPGVAHNLNNPERADAALRMKK